MKIGKANGIFKMPKRGFNPPTERINAIKHVGREFFGVKICNQVFKSSIGERNSDKAKMKRVDSVRELIKEIKIAFFKDMIRYGRRL